MAEARREREPATVTLSPVAQERIDQMTALLRAASPQIPFEATADALGEVVVKVAPVDVPALCRTLKDDPRLAFNHNRFVTGVDQMEQGIELVYCLWSYVHRHALTIRTALPLGDPRIGSVCDVWAGANWHERETAEMFGVVFEGHPDPRHLLLDDDLEIHPLLKAHPLAPLEIKQGVNAF